MINLENNGKGPHFSTEPWVALKLRHKDGEEIWEPISLSLHMRDLLTSYNMMNWDEFPSGTSFPVYSDFPQAGYPSINAYLFKACFC